MLCAHIGHSRYPRLTEKRTFVQLHPMSAIGGKRNGCLRVSTGEMRTLILEGPRLKDLLPSDISFYVQQYDRM